MPAGAVLGAIGVVGCGCVGGVILVLIVVGCVEVRVADGLVPEDVGLEMRIRSAWKRKSWRGNGVFTSRGVRSGRASKFIILDGTDCPNLTGYFVLQKQAL